MKHLDEHTDTILLATDFSQPSKRAFDAALRMARAFGAALHILHVNEEEDLLSGHSSEELTQFLDDVAMRRRAWMKDYETRATALGVEAHSLVRSGRPAETILQVADELSANMIVIGAQGSRTITTVLHGSVAKRVLRGSQRPVLIISHKAGVAPAELDGTFDKIVYPTDFSEASRTGLDLAARLAKRTKASLTLVNVLKLPTAIPSLPGELPIVLPENAADHLLEKMQQQMAELVETLAVADVDSQLSIDADPAHGIADIASKNGIDLIVVPRHSSHTLSSVLFGRTAENLAKIAPVPVLLFNPNETD